MPHLPSIRWLLFLLAAMPDGQATSETVSESRRRILDAHAYVAKAKRIGPLDAPQGLPIAFECVPRPEQFNAGFDLEKRQAIVPLPPGIGLLAPSLRPMPQRFSVGSDSSLSPVVTLMTEPLLARTGSTTSPSAFGSSYSQDVPSQQSSLQIASSPPGFSSSSLLLLDPSISLTTLTVSSQLPLEVTSQAETLATGTTTTLTEETIALPSLLPLPLFMLSERPTASDSTTANNPSITPFPFPSSASYCGETIFVSDIEAYRTQSASDYSGSELPWFLAPHNGLLWLVDPGYNWLVHNTPLSNTNITYSYSATIINANYISANQTFLSPVFVEASTTFAEQACIIGARNCGYSSTFNPPRTANYIATGSLAPTQTISCGEIKTITIGDRPFPTANFLDGRSCIVGAELLYDYFRVDHRDERYFFGDRIDSAQTLATNLQATFYQSYSGCNVTKTFFNTLILTNCPPSAGGGFNSPLIDPRAIKTQIFDAPTIQLQQVAPTPIPAADGGSNGASGSGEAPVLVPRPAPIADPLPAATAVPVPSSNKGGSTDSVNNPSGSGSARGGGSRDSGSPNTSPGGSSSGGSGSATGGSEPVANPDAPVANSGNSGGTGRSDPSSGNGQTGGTDGLPGNGAGTGAAAVGNNGVENPAGGSASGSGTRGGGQAVGNDNLSGSGNTNEDLNSVAQGSSSGSAPVMNAGARGDSERINGQMSGASANNEVTAGQQGSSMDAPGDFPRISNQVDETPTQVLPPIGAVPLGSNLASSASNTANRAIQALAAAGITPSSDLQRMISNDAAGAASALRAASTQLASVAASATGTVLSSIRIAQSSVANALSGIASVVATASISAARITTNAQGSRVTVSGLVAATALTVRTATTTDASGAVTTVLVTGLVDDAGDLDPLTDNAVRAASSTSRAGASGHHATGGSHLAAALASLFFSCIGLLL